MMNANEKLIEHFYTCFKNKDFKGMQDCYAHEAVFNDAVFKNLDSNAVKAMWEMLILKGKDLHIDFSAITANEKTGSAHWDAHYTFSATGKKVINKIDAQFEFKDGKIVKHNDHFDFYTWAKQAFGITGLLLGWTSFLRNKVQLQAKKNLDSFRSKK